MPINRERQLLAAESWVMLTSRIWPLEFSEWYPAIISGFFF